MKRSLIFAAAALGLAVSVGLTTGMALPSDTLTASVQAAVAEQQATFTIENMTCLLCPVTVKTAMENVVGVKSVVVDFDAKTATVVFDPSQASVADIAAASTNAGYPAHATKG